MSYPIEQALALLSGCERYWHPRQRAGIAEFRRRHASWLGAPQLRGFGIRDYDRAGAGGEGGEQALAVYVERRALRMFARKESTIPDYIRLPDCDEKIPIGIYPFDPIILHQGNAPGAGIKRADSKSGTLGCFVRSDADADKLYVLSNAHVLAWSLANVPQQNDRILDAGSGATIARLTRWTPLLKGDAYPNFADAAIAEVIDPGQAAFTIPGIGDIAGDSDYLKAGMRVRMRGAGGDTVAHATVMDINAHISLPYHGVGLDAVYYGFSNQIMVEPIAGKSFAVPGDSGGVWMNDRNEVVGLHFAGSESSALFNRIANVTSGLKVSIATKTNPQPPLPLDAVASAPYKKTSIAMGANGLDIMARTLWGEARGEPVAGIEAVASVIVNRATAVPPRWWGSNIAEVCQKKAQFSCWNSDDPNLSKMNSVDDGDAIFRQCKAIAERATAGAIDDATHGAANYHATSVHPQWAIGKTPSIVIGHHVFYNNIG